MPFIYPCASSNLYTTPLVNCCNISNPEEGKVTQAFIGVNTRWPLAWTSIDHHKPTPHPAQDCRV